ncbi:hypothetical protein V9T40_007599 [Parthenolecanium corni]|uniref:Uncharacterized protein n=1 Tax=Parthenolecanium corni TaxID=536013 RepID=A0AAN9TJL1_9HEMI
MAMMIAMLKCCIESLAQGTDDQQKLGMINTYQSRYGNTYRRNTYDTDDLTEVWTTNDNNGTDAQWDSSNIEGKGDESDLRLEDGGDSTIGVKDDSKPEADSDTKLDGGDSTSRGENKVSSEAGIDSKFGQPGQDATFSGGSSSVLGGSDHNSTFAGGSHSAFVGGHESSFGGGYDAGNGGVNDLGFGGDSGCGGGDYGGGCD